MEIVVNVKRMRMRCKHVDDVSLRTYIHKYSDFLVAMISVGLAQARPNQYVTFHKICALDANLEVRTDFYLYYCVMQVQHSQLPGTQSQRAPSLDESSEL